MGGLAELTSLQVPAIMAQSAEVLRVNTDLGSVRGLVLWRRDGGGELTYSAPRHHTLSVYQSGGFGVWSNDVRSSGFSGAVCVLPEGMATHWNNQGPVSHLHIYFTQDDLEAMNWETAPEVAPVIFGRDPMLQSLTAALAQQLDWSASADRLAMEHLVLSLLARLSASPKAPPPSGLAPKQMARIEEHLQDLESGAPALDALAAALDMSPRHLTRVYKAATGQTLSERHRDIQMQRATDLLATKLPLAEIALACGFSSQSHFTTAYRRHFGRTPGQARRAG